MPKRDRSRNGVSRRDFLAAGSMSLMGLSVAERLAAARRKRQDGWKSCVLVLLNGGPSQLETFDPKPDAPREIRGPLKAISTSLPGVAFCECLPRLARQAHELTIIRSLHHDAAPIHETGLQLLQNGRLTRRQEQPPSIGSLAAAHLGARHEVPPYALLGGKLSGTGTSATVGDASGLNGHAHSPIRVAPDGFAANGHAEEATVPMTDLGHEPRGSRDAYGDSRIGRLLLQSRQLVEQGVRFVTVNMFDRLEGERTWDAHGCAASAPATLFDYQNWIGLQFDQALAALLDDLRDRGLIETTMVVCAGELGRSPTVNEHGGRDHWTQVWSGIACGGDWDRGRVWGESDREAGAIVSEPLAVSELAARMKRFLGVPDELVPVATT
jgi:hypothetical protein